MSKINITQAADLSIRDLERGKPFERKGEPGVWSVEDFGSDGEIYQAIFAGPLAEKRAAQYADREHVVHA